MDNKFFSNGILDVLTAPHQWRIISSCLPVEVKPVDDRRHLEWMKSHADSHAHQELLLILRGEAQYGFMGKVYPCIPGTVFIFDSFEEHDSYYPEWAGRDCDISHLWFYITGNGIRFHEVLSTEGVLDLDKPGGWLTMTEEMTVPVHHLFFDPEKSGIPLNIKRFQVLSAVMSLLSTAIDLGYQDPEKESRESFQERVISTIQKHIHQSAGKGVSIESLSLLSGYSRYHFQRLFKQYTGKSVHQYIDECRIAKLRQMENAGYRKKEIARALGFEHQSSFARWYREK